MIRVLVADDEPLVRAGIRTVLSSADDIEVVAEAADGRAAIDQALRHRADVALVDLRMPRRDGLDVLDDLRRCRPELAVVVVTSFGTDVNVLAALERGASGFVVKTCTPDELIGAVRAAHAGAAYLSPAVTRLLVRLVAPVHAGQRRRACEQLDTLAPREKQIAHLLAEGLSNAGIGRQLHLSEATVKTYVSRVLAKPTAPTACRPRSSCATPTRGLTCGSRFRDRDDRNRARGVPGAGGWRNIGAAPTVARW